MTNTVFVWIAAANRTFVIAVSDQICSLIFVIVNMISSVVVVLIDSNKLIGILSWVFSSHKFRFRLIYHYCKPIVVGKEIIQSYSRCG